MIDQSQLYLLTQIVRGMEEACIKLEGAYQNKNAEQLEQSKKSMIDFQKKFSKELEKIKRDKKNE